MIGPRAVVFTPRLARPSQVPDLDKNLSGVRLVATCSGMSGASWYGTMFEGWPPSLLKANGCLIGEVVCCFRVLSIFTAGFAVQQVCRSSSSMRAARCLAKTCEGRARNVEAHALVSGAFWMVPCGTSCSDPRCRDHFFNAFLPLEAPEKPTKRDRNIVFHVSSEE